MVDRQGVGQLTTPGRLRIATRQSRLALWQARHVQQLLEARHPGLEVTLVPMTTRGDQILDRPLTEIGGKGLFIKELEVAMAEARADLAVHSLKDVPMELPDGFALAAILTREDPRDAFVSPRHESIDALPARAVVGTSSLRRAIQLRERRPDLQIVSLRGNVDTRLAKLDAGDYAAIVLAAAGLKRLGLAERIRAVLAPSDLLPAPGQGAIAIETRADDAASQALLRSLDDPATALAVTAERSAARCLGGNCRAPLAAYARHDEHGRLRLDVLVGDDAGRIHRHGASGDAPELREAQRLGERVAQALPAAGQSALR